MGIAGIRARLNEAVNVLNVGVSIGIRKEAEMANTGIHDTQTCNTNNNAPCVMCSWAEASQSIPRREIDDWDLDRELGNYQDRYGTDALARKLESYMIGNGVW